LISITNFGDLQLTRFQRLSASIGRFLESPPRTASWLGAEKTVSAGSTNPAPAARFRHECNSGGPTSGEHDHKLHR
jgi:hypothetical protein